MDSVNRVSRGNVRPLCAPCENVGRAIEEIAYHIKNRILLPERERDIDCKLSLLRLQLSSLCSFLSYNCLIAFMQKILTKTQF